MDGIGIAEFYSGQNVFITGATGFLGKVLVEKLLRSCPDIGNIYILVRSRRGKSPQERWDELTMLPVFDPLKQQRPNALSSKVIVLEGDASQEYLGLKTEDYKMLEDNVSVIFHGAASIRFDDPMDKAVRMNTFSALQVVNLARKMKKLKVLIHISTTYSNCNKLEVEEKVYPPTRDWREVMNICEKTDTEVLTTLTAKYLNGLPNTYIFSKSLAEAIVWEVRDQLPIVIFRPSIVISSWKEPLPGWIDNFYGPVGLIVAVGKGFIRTTISNSDVKADFTPVDIAIKAVIGTAWKRATTTNYKDKDLVYNCATTYKNITYKQLIETGLEAAERNPIEEIMWHPSISLQTSFFWYRVQAIYKHLLPAIIIDLLLRLIGKKPFLLNLHIKVHNTVMALSYFALRQWSFHNTNFIGLLKEIPSKDKVAFDFDFLGVDPSDYFENNGIGGAKKYLLKEKNIGKDIVRRRFLTFKYLHFGLLTTLYLGLLWGLYKFYTFFTTSYY